MFHQLYFRYLYVERLRVSSSTAISSICRAVDSYQRKQSTVTRSWLSLSLKRIKRIVGCVLFIYRMVELLFAGARISH